MTMTKLQPNKEVDWESWNYVLDLEKEWRKSLPRFTDKELLEIFPEAKEIIPDKISELEEKRKGLVEVIKKKLQIIKEKSAPENQWYWREVIKVWEGQKLMEIDAHINRFKHFAFVASGRSPKKGVVTDEMIQQALSVPIENIINTQLRKSGRALVGLCQLHKEKTPSFFIYPDNNSFYCYGCNQGGDVINFVRLLYNFGFPEAVKYLIGVK